VGLMVAGGDITRHLVYKVLSTRKPTVRESADLEKFSKMFLKSLDKGFTNEQWLELLKKINTLPEKTFTFQIVGSKGTGNSYYYHIFKYEYHYGWNRFKKALRRIFSTPKKRSLLMDKEFVNEETKDLLIDDILLGVSNGLTKNQTAIFSELSCHLGFVVFEIEIDKDAKGKPVLIFNYT
jgi:hypothetical protein